MVSEDKDVQYEPIEQPPEKEKSNISKDKTNLSNSISDPKIKNCDISDEINITNEQRQNQLNNQVVAWRYEQKTPVNPFSDEKPRENRYKSPV